MTYAELSESQARRSRQFAEAQTDAMSVYCDAERDLKELQAENAKLRESVKRLMTQRDERLARAEAENAKLRELAAGIGHLLFKLDVDYCAACPRDDINHPCPVYTVKGGECLYKTDLRELGIEVDG